MKFGAVTHAVGHDLPFEKTLAIIKELGFDRVLLLTSRNGKTVSRDGTCDVPFPDLLASEPENVLKALGNAGLEVASVHFSGSIDVSSDEATEKTIEDMKQYAAYNLSLGCHYFTHPAPGCGRTHVPTEEKETEIRRLAHCMNSVADAFGDQNLKVGVDIHYMAVVEGLDDCRCLLDSMPNENAGILLNVGHMTTVQSYGWLLVDGYPNRIPVVGWKDHSLAKDRPKAMYSVEVGTAHSPFELYIRAFKRHPAERVHLVNCEHVEDPERVAALGRSLKYMRELWDRV